MASKISKKEIKRYITNGLAKDITFNGFSENNELREQCDFDVLAISTGTYGMTGALLIDRKTNQLYAITERNATLFQMV